MLKKFSPEIDRRRPEAAPRSGSGALLLLLSMKVKQKRRKSCRELISINPFRPRSFSRYLCSDQWIRSQKKNLKQSYKISCTWYNFSVKKKQVAYVYQARVYYSQDGKVKPSALAVIRWTLIYMLACIWSETDLKRTERSRCRLTSVWRSLRRSKVRAFTNPWQRRQVRRPWLAVRWGRWYSDDKSHLLW